jgi:DNA polymerase-1
MSKSSSKQKILYLIDGHAQIFRAYHAIRSLSSPVTGEPTNATFGFVGMLLKLWREQMPDYVVMALDVSGDKGTFRTQIDEQYKANREAPPPDLQPQVERICEICSLMHIPVLGVPGYEADDVIATLCHRLADRDDLAIRIISKDKDLQQLLGDRVTMFDIHTDTTITADGLHEQRGITPAQVIDMLALMGDNVDNIPGAKGIGPKTAAKLIGKYGSIESLLEHLDELTPAQRKNIEAAADRLQLNRQLVKLCDEVPVEFDLDESAAVPPDREALEPLFRRLGFTRHLQELETLTAPSSTVDAPSRAQAIPDSLFPDADEAAVTATTSAGEGPQAVFRAITTKEELAELVRTLRDVAEQGQVIAVDTETDSLRPLEAHLCGVSLAWEDTGAAYIPVRSPQPEDHLDEATVIETLRPILEDESVRKVGQNLKYDLNILRHAGVELRGIAGDTMIQAHLLDASRTSFKLDNLALAYLNYEMIPIDQLIGRGRQQITFDRVPLEQATPYAAEDALVAWRLHHQFAPQLRAMKLQKLLEDVELPLLEVLAEMEYRGVMVDPAELQRQCDAMGEKVAALRRRIIDTAGRDFNPDSPKQLAVVLFDDLGCTVLKRRKTGPSTDSEVLRRIADEQPPPGSLVAELVLEYREMTKLVGTYLARLADYINPDTGRIHASFHQAGTSTGRLSSSEPNLQNIPIRTDIGRRIRRAFVAPPGEVLLAADYSQIELRILAHLSQDEGLIDAFRQDMDIHTAVAAEVFGVQVNEVTPTQRGSAKMVNFGIVYGITPFGLARRLGGNTSGDDVERARRIIDDYKHRYPKINSFLAQCVEQAERYGYVTTILGRRRPIPEIRDRRGNIFSLGQRIAINSVVQGSAADLIKLAMVRLHRRIVEENLPLKMLLQIHDELVFETPTDDAPAMQRIVEQEMTGAMELSVPLKVDAHHGPTWFDAK